MSEKLIDNWQKIKNTIKKAEDWNNLPKGKKYSGSKFEISIPHCKPPMLSRMGQQYAGSQAYWETDQDFSLAILEYIVSEWGDIYPKVIERLKEKEQYALLEKNEKRTI